LLLYNIHKIFYYLKKEYYCLVYIRNIYKAILFFINYGGFLMIAITNATIFNGKGEVIENHMILVQDGKIESVTAQEELDKSYQVIDAKGKIVTPGLIDVHTHLGISEEGVGK